MKYYTRNFYNSILPYHIIDEFTIYDEASIYDDKFYNTLMIEKEKELKNHGIEYGVHSLLITGAAVKLLSMLPASIEIPDIRAFLLYAISPELHDYITDLRKKQDIMIQNKLQEIQNRYNGDQKVMPKQWLTLYDIPWFDAGLEIIESKEDEILLIIGVVHNLRYTVLLKEVSGVYKEKEYDIYRIIFTEVLYEDSRLILNIMTHSNEYSFNARDISITKTITS